MSALISKLKGIAHLHDRKLTALKLAQAYPERGRAYVAEWAGLRDAAKGLPRCYWNDPQTQAYYDRGYEDGLMILYVHGALESHPRVPCVAA